jgi:hypothetical protein
MADLRILFVDIHLHALNPTNSLMSTMVAYAGNVKYYGPGYVSSETIATGIKKFIDREGPFDVLFIGPNIPVVADPADWQGALTYIQKYSAWSPEKKTSEVFLKEFFGLLRSLEIPIKLACLVTLDYYGSDERQVDRLCDLGVRVYAPDAGFVQDHQDMPGHLKKERHFLRKQERLHNAWLDFLVSNESHVVSGLHFVGDGEFIFRSLNERRTTASVPGAEYLLRKRARKLIKRRGIDVASKRLFNAYRVLNKLKLPVYSNYLFLRMFNVSYQASLGDTRFVYAARGAFGIPVRKFLEIPAAGAVMICTPPVGFNNMGFENGRHFIFCEPEDLADMILTLSKDVESLFPIVRNAQDLVRREHSAKARGYQLRSCLRALLSGTYISSRWIDGKYEVKTSLCVE